MEITIDRKKWEGGREIIENLIRSRLLDQESVEMLEHVTGGMREIEDMLDKEPLTVRWSDEHEVADEEEGFFKKWE